MQEMLRHCGFSALAQTQTQTRPRSSQTSTEAQRWNEIPEPVRNVLTPFLQSRYSVNLNPGVQYQRPQYPIFSNSSSHGTWLQTFVYDLLQHGQGVNVEMVFPVLARVIRGYDLSIATFILPFAALNVIVSDDDKNMENLGQELLTVLQTEIRSPEQPNASLIKQCSEVRALVCVWLSSRLKSNRMYSRP
jgi:serine/threonine-protein kinase ATR